MDQSQEPNQKRNMRYLPEVEEGGVEGKTRRKHGKLGGRDGQTTLRGCAVYLMYVPRCLQ